MSSSSTHLRTSEFITAYNIYIYNLTPCLYIFSTVSRLGFTADHRQRRERRERERE